MKESAYAVTARQVIERTLQQHGRQDPKQLRRAPKKYTTLLM